MPAFEPDLHFLQSSWEIRQKQRPSGGSVGLVLMLFHYWQPSLLLFLKRLVILEDFYTASYQVNVTCSLSDLEPEVKLPTSTGSSKKQESSRKNIHFCLIGYTKAFDCVDYNKLWKILNKMWISDHLACLLTNLYAGQEATVRTGHGTTDVPNRERSTLRLYIVTLLIDLIGRVQHEKCWAGRSKS